MEDILIREAREQDVARILELYGEAGIEAETGFTPQEARVHMALFLPYPSLRVFVAEVQREVVGTYELLIMDNLAKCGRRSGVVEDIAVWPRLQGRGIGRAMMLHAQQQCRQAGCYKLVLSSGLKRTGAHDFYDATGFEKHGYSFRVDVES